MAEAGWHGTRPACQPGKACCNAATSAYRREVQTWGSAASDGPGEAGCGFGSAPPPAESEVMVEPGSSRGQALGVLLAVLLLTGLGLVVLIGAVLRETPLFWRQAGGYPVELRHLVLTLFYPALAGYFVWLAASSAVVLLLLRRGSRGAAACLLAITLNWLLLAGTMTVISWNNVENLLRGLPLHYHPP